MKNIYLNIITLSLCMTYSAYSNAEESIVNTLMDSYVKQGAKKDNPKRGEILWNKTYTGKAPFTERSCKLCHTANLKNKGEHTRTGKMIKPLSPTINSKSLSSLKHVKKWFKRNCKWTLGKECSAQEKADILAFINLQ